MREHVVNEPPAHVVQLALTPFALVPLLAAHLFGLMDDPGRAREIRDISITPTRDNIMTTAIFGRSIGWP
jgi:hypothetical protein